jgi:hypothetical protein
MASSDTGAQDPFELAWGELEKVWENEEAHRRFIAFCTYRAALSEAGRRYREVLERDPARREQAARQLQAVLAAALASLEPAKLRAHSRAGRRAPLLWGVRGVGLALTAYAILTVLRLFAR